jgi:hypothetical protein
MLLQMGDGREGQMTTTITTQMVPQGLLVPRSTLGEWLERGVDVVKEKERIVIRPRPARLDEREEAIRILEEAGLLLPLEPLPASHVPISAEKRAELSRKFSVGRPLSELVIEDREDRA